MEILDFLISKRTIGKVFQRNEIVPRECHLVKFCQQDLAAMCI